MDHPDEQRQSDLDRWRVGTTTSDVTKTYRLRLETSHQKLSAVQDAIDEWQRVAAYTADLLPSFPPYRWGSRDTQLRRRVRAHFDDLDIYAHDRDAAVAKVREAFASWDERGRPGERPRGDFGSGQYLRMSTSSSSKQRRQLVRNDRGFGLQVNILKPRDPIWFHANVGRYQREPLERVLDGDADLGVVELRRDGDELYAHVSVTESVEVYEPGDVATTVGVDLGERVLWAVAVVSPDGVEHVELERGREFRHHREQLDRKRERLSKQGDLEGVRATKDDRRRYTEQVTHTASRRIVDIAAEYAPAVLQIEDLTHYRETADDAIHDWPYAMLREQLKYKATEAGIPVEDVDAAGTSTTCRRCGTQNPAYRDDVEWHCRDCGYEVHADVNAAINIAQYGD